MSQESNKDEAKEAAEAMRELRNMMLSSPASGLGFEASVEFPRVYGAVLEFNIGKDTATVVSMCDGAASLYTTTTFGILGGIGYAPAKKAAIEFVKTAEAYFDEGSPTSDYLYPEGEKVRFYLLGYNGHRFIETELKFLEEGKDRYLELWVAGQDVLTELRVMMQNQQQQQG